MTLHTHRRRDRPRCRITRVWLDGVDVSSRCFYVDGRRGVVRLYSVDAGGKKYLNAHHVVVWEERHGRVRIGKKAA